MLLTRREALANGFGGLALAHLLAGDLLAEQPRPRSDLNGGLHPRAKVRRVMDHACSHPTPCSSTSSRMSSGIASTG